jgi:hypothetical protein
MFSVSNGTNYYVIFTIYIYTYIHSLKFIKKNNEEHGVRRTFVM